jgi:hypothetical protein
MSSFGPYETTREIASGHGSVVYSAHRSGETRDNYAVKVFSLQAFLGEETPSELDPLLVEFNLNFARSVEVQKKAAEASRNVAPILEVGRDQATAWYATKLYPRSVHKILEGRVALGKEWFFHIIYSVARGALAFKRTCGRAHGEIQPSNILISASQKINDAEVVLSDPLPGDAAESTRYEAADLNAIGQVIYQLVRRRQIEDAADQSILPLVPSAEWTSIFGKDTDAWLSLCNRLLDPNLSLETFNLERLEAELAKLRPRPAVTAKVIAMAAAGLLLAGVAGFYFVRASGRGELIISSRPAGAQIRLTAPSGKASDAVTAPDGKWKLTLEKGTYSVRAEYPGLGAMTNVVEVRGRDSQSVPFVFRYGTVTIDSQPRGALIRVDGTNLLVGRSAAVTPLTLEALKPGPVTFQLDLKEKGYLPVNLPIDLQDGQSTNLVATLVLKPINQGTVEFDSNPIGAIFELNGTVVATNRFETKSLAPGTYQFVGRYRDLWPEKRTNVVLEANSEAKVFFYFERARVSLDSFPQGASISVSNRPLGVTPIERMSWPTGVVTFRFSKAGYEPTNVVVNIFEDNGRVDPFAQLTSTNGTLLLTVEPAPAVVLDAVTRAELARTVPGQARELTLEPGRRELIIQAPGYQPLPTNFIVVSKQKRAVTVQLPAELIPVAFTADPPGAELFDPSGRPFGPLETVTGLPATNYTFIARQVRHPTLSWITNDVVVVKGRPNAHKFEFIYSSLVITSSPSNLKVFEVLDGGRRQFVGITPTNRPVVKPGPIKLEFVNTDGTNINRHEFQLTRGPFFAGTYFRPPRPKALTNSVGMVFEWIDARGTNGDYWVGKFEVTQAQYQAIMGANPSSWKRGDPALLPVETVSIEDAGRFCRDLTARDQSFLQGTAYPDWTYVLPTQAQWNYYVAAAPLTTAFTSENGKRDNPTNVGSFGPNDFGLHDVRGNVWEWCAEGVMRGAAYGSFNGSLSKQLDVNFVLKRDPNMLAPFNCGFRCLLIPSTQSAQR